MERREAIKSIFLGGLLPTVAPQWLCKDQLNGFGKARKVVFASDWHNWPDMSWVGPEYWSNPLQDWYLKDGNLVCGVAAKNRNVYLLTVQNQKNDAVFTVSLGVDVLDDLSGYKNGIIGVRLGSKGDFDDFRRSAVFGNGLDLGLTPSGGFKIGSDIIETTFETLPKSYTQIVKVRNKGEGKSIEVNILNPKGESLFKHTQILRNAAEITGGFALVCDLDLGNKKEIKPVVAYSDWKIEGENLFENDNQIFGPICFAQYTLHRKKLKLTAQLAPIEKIPNHKVSLELQINGKWKQHETLQLKHEGRAVNFQIENFDFNDDIPYRVKSILPLKNASHEYIYEGTIAAEPNNMEELKVAVFSCNFHYGFPDADIPLNLSKLHPDVILFLGDQFYEGTGGFGVEFQAPYDRQCLDYLRKWMMFGWSYRELFRHKPCAIIPDDHDVYHGNLWGEEGKAADTSKGFGAPAQDSGGYKMPADWVNMVQFTQTSHLPDPFDATSVKQGISVYYTHWNYAGISFAIIEDRKFKSAPRDVLPKEADVVNGWIQNPDFNILNYNHLDAELLGKRQERFLEDWVEDWSENAQMKVVLSQTNFAAVATLPKGTKSGAIIPSLPIPEKGEYVVGDYPTVDMDSNGWPSKKRNRAVEIIRKGFAFHIAGDQHLGSYIQYGLEEHGDSGCAFAGPALNNIWPRRFWPDVDISNHSYNNPAYVGNHVDGFGNRMSVLAASNPYNHHKEPAILYNRAVGYGLVIFNKGKREITTHCWPRFVDPVQENEYIGWPITIDQERNFGKKAVAWLPELRISSDELPILKIFDDNGLVYALRLRTRIYKPKVFNLSAHTIIVENPNTTQKRVITNVMADGSQDSILEISL